MDFAGGIKEIMALKTFREVEERVEAFLFEAHTLEQRDLELLMACYAYKKQTDLRKKYFALYKIYDNPFGMNQFTGNDFLPKHCFTFAKQYQKQISEASEPVREEFYRIFPLTFKSRAEHNVFHVSRSTVNYAMDAPLLHERDEIIATNESRLVSVLAAAGADYVIVAGTGVSAQLVEDKNRSLKIVSTWENLVTQLRQDIETFIGKTLTAYFEKWYPTAEDKDLEPVTRGHILHSMIEMYNLFNNTDIDYTRFIARVFHSVAPRDPVPPLAIALGNRNVPLATTNYDMLLEQCLKRFEYNLAEQCRTKNTSNAGVVREVEEGIEEERKKINPANYNHYVYHLHGVWHSKAELTLGVEYWYSPKAFKNSMRVLTTIVPTSNNLSGASTTTTTSTTTSTTASTTSLATSTGSTTSRMSKKRSRNTYAGQNTPSLCKPVVFIGTKSGVFDPHFLPWIKSSPTTHFILMRENEFENMVATIKRAKLVDKLVPVVYGAGYDDLAVFVRDKLPVRAV